jgi:hypothetical protein
MIDVVAAVTAEGICIIDRFRCLHRERNRVDAAAVKELEKQAIRPGRGDL